MSRPSPFQLLRSAALITLGSALFALGFCWCFQPNHIAFGGIAGVGQIVNYLLPAVPVGVVVVALNVPLFLLGWRLLGRGLLASSLYAMALSSVLIDLLDAVYAFAPMEPMLSALFGGALVGLSLGVVIGQGATTGGTDLLARLLKLRLAWLPMGKLLLAVDLVVIAAVGAAFGDLGSALCGVVALYVSSLVMDGVLYGMDTAKVAYIISDRSDAIAAAITGELERGVTILPGRGGWTGGEKEVLLCAFRQRQIARLKALVKGLDPDAFLIVCPAHEVLGEGFRRYREHDI